MGAVSPSKGVDPLDADEMQAWRTFISAATRVRDRLDREMHDAHDLTLGDYEILAALSEAPERRLQMTELAALSLLGQSRLTYRVDRLEGEGFVERVPCEIDGRRIYAHLTPRGFRKLESAYPVHLEGVRRYVIDPQNRRDLAGIARAMAAMLEALP